jgi:hypothetical protein
LIASWRPTRLADRPSRGRACWIVRDRGVAQGGRRR